MSLRVTEVRATPAPKVAARSGLLAWITCVVGGQLRLDGLALRRTRNGRLTISFPGRRDRGGRQRFPVRPLDDEAREEIERQILRELGIDQKART